MDGEFTPITTSEQFETAVAERVKTEREAVEQKYANHIAPETYQKEKGEWEKQKKAYEIASTKVKVAHEMGLSHDAVEFLHGDDENSIKKSAEKLKGLAGIRTAPLASHESSTSNATEVAFKKMLSGLKGE